MQSEAKKLRVAIIGCGKIADAHAEVVTPMEGAELVAVCDREPILAEQLAVRFGVPAWYSDAAEMLAKERLDVVHITTPPGVHLMLSQQCAAAGAHVYLEKPLALDAVDARALIESVQAAGKMMSINYWPNFDPQAMELKQMVANGELGDVVHVEAYIGYDLEGAYGQALMADGKHWVHSLPGKLFQNMLDHICNRMTPFLPADQEAEVRAWGFKRRKTVRGDGTDAMLDELRVVVKAGGVSAYGTLCSHARPVANTLRVFGTKASVEVDFNNRTVVKMVTQKYPSALGRLFPAFAMSKAFWKQGWKNVGLFRKAKYQYFAGMATLLEKYYEAIRSGGAPPIAYEEILRVAAIMDRVHEQVYPKSGEVAGGAR